MAKVKSPLTREEVLAFLKDVRPELTEEDWRKGDVVTVLAWAIPTYINRHMREEVPR